MPSIVSERSTDRSKRLELLESLIPFEVTRKICRLNDHKGILEVFWREHPLWKNQRVVNSLWYDLGEQEVQHYLIKEL